MARRAQLSAGAPISPDGAPANDGVPANEPASDGADRSVRTPGPARRVPARGLSPADAVVVLGVVVTFAYWWHLTRRFWFKADDWPLALQSASFSGLVEPYNDHLSVNILAIYRVLLELFGFSTYTPWRVVGLVSLAAVPLAYHLTSRSRLGPTAAAAVALLLLWFPRVSLEPGGLNHALAALGAVICAWGLDLRGWRGTLVAAGGLAFALGSAGGGVAVAAAVVVHLVCTRPAVRRAAVTVAPMALWTTWYLLTPDKRQQVPAELRMPWDNIARTALEDAADTFRSLAFEVRAAGFVLLALYLLLLVWHLRRGLSVAANQLAWTAALVAWWAGLAYSRWFLVADGTFRYEFVAAVMVALAIRPSADAPWTDAVARRLGAQAGTAVSPWRPVASVAAPLVVLALAVGLLRTDVEAGARSQTATATSPAARSGGSSPPTFPTTSG